MIMNMCAYTTCPHHAAPCEFTYEYLEEHLCNTTVCPIGENENFLKYDPDNTFFCMIIGTRNFNDYDLFQQKTDNILSSKSGKTIMIISGDGGNTDKYAERYATEHNYHLIVFPAQWDEFGKKAGFIRNEQMHRYIASKQDRGVIAFWDGESKETFQSFDLSQKYNNQIRVIKYKNIEK